MVVMRQTNEEERPCVTAFAEPKNLGVCASSLVWDDDDKGWDLRDKAFAEVDLEFAVGMTKDIFRLSKNQPD